MKIFLGRTSIIYKHKFSTTGPRAYFTTDNENLYLITGMEY